MRTNSKKVKKVKTQKTRRGPLVICLLLLVVGAAVLFYLNRMRKELIEECENNLLWEVQLSAREVSDSITDKFDHLEMVQEMAGRSYESGPEVAESMDALRERYNMSYLGFVDRNYVYYDSTGEIVKDAPRQFVDMALEGQYVVTRTHDRLLQDGVIFLIPYREMGETRGVICSGYARESLLEELSAKQQQGTELVVDASGSVILSEDDISNYLDGISWEEFLKNGQEWKHKQAFDEEMLLKGCAVATATNQHGKAIYFAAAQLQRYPGIFMIRLTSSDVVEKEIRNEMLSIYAMMILMAVLMLSIVLLAFVTYLRNRREIYDAAYVDQLTGIPSKAKHKLDAQALIDRQEQRYAYVTFDVDNFKYINEMFGYEYGNRMLIHIANTLKHFAKENELYSRISADIFAMLLTDMGTKQELTQRVEELFTMIIEHREPEENLNECTLKFSCGIYRIDGKKDINVIRANANLARTESKKSVMDDIVYYDADLKSRRVEERELEYEAEESLQNKEFLVYFQPKYDVDNEKIIGAEALIRWNHPTRGMLSPGVFVPVFETNGFISKVDLYVLDQVCELLETWIEAGIPPICISVNLSRIHLYERDLVGRLTGIVKKHQVPPEFIEFELTESAFYDKTERLLQIMSEIKKAGFRLSMDDFGSGYSSLNLLRRLPVDVLKLDKVFLEDYDETENGTRGRRIVKHVISMAKDLRMKVLAEGVETVGQKEFLQDARCDMIQGYYYAKPMPMKEFELLYREQSCLKNSVHKPVVKFEKQDPA